MRTISLCLFINLITVTAFAQAQKSTTSQTVNNKVAVNNKSTTAFTKPNSAVIEDVKMAYDRLENNTITSFDNAKANRQTTIGTLNGQIQTINNNINALRKEVTMYLATSRDKANKLNEQIRTLEAKKLQLNAQINDLNKEIVDVDKRKTQVLAEIQTHRDKTVKSLQKETAPITQQQLDVINQSITELSNQIQEKLPINNSSPAGIQKVII